MSKKTINVDWDIVGPPISIQVNDGDSFVCLYMTEKETEKLINELVTVLGIYRKSKAAK